MGVTIVLSIVFRRGLRPFEQIFCSIGFASTKATSDSYRRNYECSRVTASQNVQVDIFQKSGLKFIKKDKQSFRELFRVGLLEQPVPGVSKLVGPL